MASYLTPLPLCEEFARGLHSQCCYIAYCNWYLPISLKRIKRIQVRDREINSVNFADHEIFFLVDITYLNKIQIILKLYEDLPRG